MATFQEIRGKRVPRKDDEALMMRALYLDGFSLRQAGEARGVTPQTVTAAFKRRGWALRSRRRLPAVTFLGDTYTADKNGYYRRTRDERVWLHHAVWRHYFGVIPPGHVIHHKDRDKTNNDPSNLLSLTLSEHQQVHYSSGTPSSKRCPVCGQLLIRKRQSSGRIETPAEVRRRTYCGVFCFHVDRYTRTKAGASA